MNVRDIVVWSLRVLLFGSSAALFWMGRGDDGVSLAIIAALFWWTVDSTDER